MPFQWNNGFRAIDVEMQEGKKMKLFAKTKSSHPGVRALLDTLNEQLESTPVFHRLRQSQVWIALALASLALMWGGLKIGDRFGLLIGFVLSVGFNALVIFYDQWRLNVFFPGRELEGQDPWGIVSMTRELVSRLRETADFPMPTLRLLENETPLIIASGLSFRRFQILISSGAIEKLETDELRSAIAFQLMRFYTNQLRIATASAALADFLLLIAASLDAVFMLRFFLDRKPRRSCPGPISWLLNPFAASFLRLVIPRKSILALDHLTAQTFKCEAPFAQALIKLDSYKKTMPTDVNLAEASLAVVSPLVGLPQYTWASVQPPTSTRLQHLIGRFPL